MVDDSSICSHSTTKILSIGSGKNVPLEQLGRSLCRRKYIKSTTLEVAVEKESKGITWKD